ncbi:MAG TPA: hypothetical protein VKG26_09865 [Bacteroidia bacterium]|nr:hypothetical protein [Bacteroidia bacterium]
MKRLIIILIVLTSCGNKEVLDVKKVIKSAKVNYDSLQEAKRDIDFHWEKYKSVYQRLQIDSLEIDSFETYRLVVSHSWGYNLYGGQPTSITFHKNADTCYVVIKDFYDDSLKPIIFKVVKFIPESYFDSIRVMFNNGTFWRHSLTSTENASINTDPDYIFFEAVKNGKHKLVSQLHLIDRIPILKNWQYNFYHFSNYSKLFDEDYKWSKNHPPSSHPNWQDMPSVRKYK